MDNATVQEIAGNVSRGFVYFVKVVPDESNRRPWNEHVLKREGLTGIVKRAHPSPIPDVIPPELDVRWLVRDKRCYSWNRYHGDDFAHLQVVGVQRQHELPFEALETTKRRKVY